MYIKFNDSVEHYNGSIAAFKTQNGNKGVRIIGEDIPENTSGFKAFDDEDNVIGDFSAFTHIYNENEYTEAEEQKVPSHSAYTQPAPSVIDSLASSINAVNQRVSDITPYTESKIAYIDDTQVVFNAAKDGNVSVFMTDGDGQNVPFTFERVNEQIKVSFEKRESLATVTISIQ